MLALILAGCAGAGNGSWQQVHGGGVTFNAPSGWNVSGTAASHGDVDHVEVVVFRLEHPYVRAEWPAVSKELDRTAASLAAQLKGKVTKKSSIKVGAFDARSYSVDFAGKTEEITFVVNGRREYQLLCRRNSAADDSPCRELVRSFRLG